MVTTQTLLLDALLSDSLLLHTLAARAPIQKKSVPNTNQIPELCYSYD